MLKYNLKFRATINSPTFDVTEITSWMVNLVDSVDPNIVTGPTVTEKNIGESTSILIEVVTESSEFVLDVTNIYDPSYLKLDVLSTINFDEQQFLIPLNDFNIIEIDHLKKVIDV
jgi:hypothetical protein